MNMTSSIPYHEPSIVAISILSGFLLTLNIANYGLDKLAFCGLLGQVLLGIAWGTPGGKLLDAEVQNVVMQLGYLGLILIVYEGIFPRSGYSVYRFQLTSCCRRVGYFL